MENRVPEDVYTGELISYPGPCRSEGENLVVEITEAVKSRWIFGVPGE